jgi:ADP-ribose 1''-phosphate phosphatase
MVTHQKISLFDAPKGSIIVHACNSQGVWGSGIAKEFKERYPHSYHQYHMFCKGKETTPRKTACGLGQLSFHSTNEDHWVGWIVTSHNYGDKKDSSEQIKANTALALRDLCHDIYVSHAGESIDVYSNKFNSGLFGVHWEDSELILNTVLRDYPRINWIVCDPS